MKLFLVRHGFSTGNENPREYFEKMDCEIGLTDKGFEQSVDAAKKIVELNHTLKRNNTQYPDEPLSPSYFNLYHSPYLRAKQTAESIRSEIITNEKHQINEFIESPLLHEREWGGLRDIVSGRLKTEEHFNFFYRPENGESFSNVYTRAAIFHQWLLNNPNRYENNIIVAHGEFNKVYLMHLLNWSVEEFGKWKNQKNGEVWLVEDGKLSSLTPLSTSPYSKEKVN